MFIDGSGCLHILTTKCKSYVNDNIQWLIVINTFLNSTLKVDEQYFWIDIMFQNKGYKPDNT